MDSALTDLLQCPVCVAPMMVDDGAGNRSALSCRQGHRFDRARQGYVNLLTGKASGYTPDTAAMVEAREDFLSGGHYDLLAGAVSGHTQRAVEGKASPAIADAGAGTGFYLDAVLQSIPGARALALDISKYALRRAARSLPEVLCLVWDIWRPLPVADGALDVVLNIFAPRNPSEFARVLAPGGRLIVVTPLPGHLEEIRRTASLLEVQAEKSDHLAKALEPHFSREMYDDVEFSMSLTPANIRLAALMGPAAHHLDEPSLQNQL
ncbi:putative RNA methyltransferase, partial [Arthrobacter sp. H14]|uniref:putative RNA methyltransferase n=1 Tax=Arthrobacter sp. H14 TaxID=1312959 RepID=UPI00047B8E79